MLLFVCYHVKNFVNIDISGVSNLLRDFKVTNIAVYLSNQATNR